MAKNIIVSQIGARHRYAIPNILHKNRMLKSLFTDSYRYTILGKTSHIFLKLGSSRTAFKRLCQRLPKIPKSCIQASDKPTKIIIQKECRHNIIKWNFIFYIRQLFL